MELKDSASSNVIHNNLSMLTATKPKIIDMIISKLVFKNLLKINEDLDYKSFNEMAEAIYANTATLSTTLTRGKQVHVVLIMKGTLYSTLAMGTTW